MANACVFCGATERALTNEHVWGDWLRRAVRHPPGQANSERVRLDGKGETWREPVFQQRVKIACASCNNGWMSQIEVRAQRFVTSMVSGMVTRLRPADQQRVATWVALKALVSQHQHPAAERFIPAGHSHEFESAREPLATMTIWLGGLASPIPAKVADPGWYFTSSSAFDLRQNLTPHAPPSLRQNVDQGGAFYSVSMNVGPLLMMLMGHETAGVQGYASQAASPCFERIWPVTGHFKWPPKPIESLGLGNADLWQHFGVMGYGVPPEGLAEAEMLNRAASTWRPRMP